MKRALLVLVVVVVCLPMVFVSWLLLAAYWTRMDAVTAHLPVGMREMVAQVAMRNATLGKGGRPQLERVNRLDLHNAEAWSGRCTYLFGESVRKADVATCRMAVSLQPDAGNYYGLGKAQEKAGDVCAAEESYTKAAGQDSGTNDYTYTESMGRAAFLCGDVPGARAGLEVALEKAARSLKDDEDEEITDTKDDMLKDRGILLQIYQKQHEVLLATEVCSQIHPNAKGCTCTQVGKRDVTCTERR